MTIDIDDLQNGVHANDMIVVSIEPLGFCDDYVYDIETEDGTFIASSSLFDRGLVCKNTDSCYVTFDVPRHEYILEDGSFDEVAFMKKNFELSEECAARISSEFKHPIKLEFEKIMYPFFIYAKKRYAYKEWTKYTHPNDIEYKGLSLVRRDYCAYIKYVCSKVFKILMTDASLRIEHKESEIVIYETIVTENKSTGAKETSIEEVHIDLSLRNTLDKTANKQLADALGSISSPKSLAILYTRKAIYDLLVGHTVKLDQLILSKSLKASYKMSGTYIKWNKGLCTIHKCEVSKGQKCRKCDKCNPNMSTNKGSLMKFMAPSATSNKACKECQEAYTFVSLPHVVIANRLRKKDPNNGPKPPDRVNFVYTYTKDVKKKKQWEFTHSPDELEGRSIYYLYYFQHQLQNPIDQIFEIMYSDGTSFIYQDIVQACINITENQQSLSNFF
jgi:hypothetical protein